MYNATTEPNLTLERLMAMDPRKLEALYRRREAGPIPDGDSAGEATFSPGTSIGKMWQGVLSVIWQGKVFDREHGVLINKVLGGKWVGAKVYYGESKLDGKQSIIIDYSETAVYPLSLVRDEIRMVAPSLYLGYAYMRIGGKYVNAIHFALYLAKPSV